MIQVSEGFATIQFAVTAEFPEEDTGLNGDMNEDGELNVLDVWALVNTIITGDWFYPFSTLHNILMPLVKAEGFINLKNST